MFGSGVRKTAEKVHGADRDRGCRRAIGCCEAINRGVFIVLERGCGVGIR